MCCCRVCRQPFGPYSIGWTSSSADELPRLNITDLVRRSDEHVGGSIWWDSNGPHMDGQVLPAEAGPRTGTGLYAEAFDGQDYVRVVCQRPSCRRNEKIPAVELQPGEQVEIVNQGGEVVYYL